MAQTYVPNRGAGTAPVHHGIAYGAPDTPPLTASLRTYPQNITMHEALLFLR